MIETNGIVSDVTGDYPLIIDCHDGITEFFFACNDGLYLVSTIPTADLLLALINADNTDEQEKAN